MKATIKKANLKRLASLSALALGGTVGTAHASSIVFSGPVNAHIGNCPDCKGSIEMNGPGGAVGNFTFAGSCQFPYGCVRSVIGGVVPAGQHGTVLNFQLAASVIGLASDHAMSAFPQNAKWGAAKATGHAGVVALINATTDYSHAGMFSRFNGTDKYLLFEFTGGNLLHADYGWAQINAVLAGCYKHKECLDVTLVDYAYDTSGALLPAGDTTGTPEPSTFALSGLAALALGAKGLRAWRAARKASRA